MFYKFFKISLFSLLCGLCFQASAQTNTVKFGKNRLQFKLFDWQYYKTDHFLTYFNQGGKKLGKYVAQTAERELNNLEKTMGYTVREDINIIVYNSYQEMKQSNIGMDLNWQNTGGVTKLVGNKMMVFFDGNHNKLKVQIREGIAKVILNNLLFGASFSEFAGNSISLHLPKWFTDGYVAYLAQHWNTDLDNKMKQIMSGNYYQDFSEFALEYPTLAGHAFWYYISSAYGKTTPSYLVYMSRIDRSMKKAFENVLDKKYKEVMRDFIVYNQKRYRQDNRGRRQVTKGRVATTKMNLKTEKYRIHPSPVSRNYALVEFNDGNYEVQLFHGYFKPRVLLKSGVRQMKSKINPDYPLLAWSPKGTHLGIIYAKRGGLMLKTFDLITNLKHKFKLPEDFQLIKSFQYLPTKVNKLVMSATKDGQTDIFTYNINTGKYKQLTDDVYDDVDPSYVGFAKKNGIIFSSNRPEAYAPDGDTVLPHHRYNIFILGNWETPKDVTISQLSDLKKGNAFSPMQYNPDLFTFVGDQNGIKNRYVGTFHSESSGLDSIYYVGDKKLRNPSKAYLDSILAEQGLKLPDSMTTFATTADSATIFPITDYSDGIISSYSAGRELVTSETVKRGNMVRSYELEVNQRALDRRNIHPKPTSFRKYQEKLKNVEKGLPIYYQKIKPDSSLGEDAFFQSEFGYEPPDTSFLHQQRLRLKKKRNSILDHAELKTYGLKFSTDYLIAQLDNSVLITRYQPFTGSGPVKLQSPFNGLIQVGVSDLMEDIKFTGGFRVPSTFDGSEYYFSYSNLRHYVDFKALYYRKVDRVGLRIGGNPEAYGGKQRTNLYQIQGKYPLDEVRSIRLTLGYRSDKITPYAVDELTLKIKPHIQKFGVTRLEYVYDNTINPVTNIWKGLRWKAYMEMFPQLNKAENQKERNFTFNFGLDARYYQTIYKNFIWATRVAADFSWGNRKVLYYLGGVDNWLGPKYNQSNVPSGQEVARANYAYQTLAENLRGYKQNVKHGNNVVLMNTELRLPVFATLIDKPIRSNLIRNFQITSFLDVGTAWYGGISDIKSSEPRYANSLNPPTVIVKIKKNSLGPFVAGYGFGARTKIAGYFLRVDAGWPVSGGFFNGGPQWYFALGVDF